MSIFGVGFAAFCVGVAYGILWGWIVVTYFDKSEGYPWSH